MAVFKNQSALTKTVEKPYLEDGVFVVPPESEDYWLRLWAWKRARGIGILTAFENRYLNKHELEKGKIKHWLGPEGLRPLI